MTKRNQSKAAKPKAEKPESPKLHKPARQVLAALAKAKNPLSRRAIADHAEKTDRLINHRIATETKTYAALAKAGFIQVSKADGGAVHSITDSGRKALAAALKAAKR